MYKTQIICFFLLLVAMHADAQPGEAIAPLGYRAITETENLYTPSGSRSAAKNTAITLPFIEDFTKEDYYPDTNIWADKKIYINNNMSINPIGRGVATLDALDETGLPYEKVNKGLIRYADSLTSKPIDLSSYSPGDSLYFSFFYQPEGWGFDPQPEDSLMLYFRRSNSTSPWTRVWRVGGSTLQPFKQVLIPITDVNFFNVDFQFRFVNKASINNTDDTWNVDYIRLAANRNMYDTAIQEVAYTEEPSIMLKDYASMPYHQYIANEAGERADLHTATIRNSGGSSVAVSYGYTAREINTGASLSSGTGSINIAEGASDIVSFPTYSMAITPIPARNIGAVVENRYYLEQNAFTGLIDNDTIVKRQRFENYLAYDDGTPEKSYYLKMFSTLPGKIAVEHRLNVQDTITGLAIYFGRQVPYAYQKYFSAVIYKDIAYGGGSDNVLYQEDLLIPNYLPENNFWIYKFRRPVIVPQGKFYVGTIQPALGSSDSLYFGLDMHRTLPSHVFFSVLNEWKASTLPGAVMIRPMFGYINQTDVKHMPIKEADLLQWDVIPNPATDKIKFNFKTNGTSTYTITDVQGKIMLAGAAVAGQEISLNTLPSGVYIAHLYTEGYSTTPHKLVKL